MISGSSLASFRLEAVDSLLSPPEGFMAGYVGSTSIRSSKSLWEVNTCLSSGSSVLPYSARRARSFEDNVVHVGLSEMSSGYNATDAGADDAYFHGRRRGFVQPSWNDEVGCSY